MRAFLAALLILAPALTEVASASAPAQTWLITDPGQGLVQLPSGPTGATQLSGLAWAGGTQYYAVSDAAPVLYPLRIEIDPRSGAIRSAVLSNGVRLRGSEDLEGAVYEADATVLVSDEVGPAIRRYRVSDGARVGVVPLPPVYAQVRKNQGLEGLSLSPEGDTLWTANEEALKSDGPASTFSAGTVVRLQRFARSSPSREGEGKGEGDENVQDPSDCPHPSPLPHGRGSSEEWSAVSQWAYVTDAIPGDVLRPGRDVEASGVSELVALPDGGLLVLERAYGAVGTRSRLYEVDFAGATDISAIAGLAGATFTPVRKTLLWERIFPDANFEGAALGPTLANGGRSLVLVSDDGHAMRQALYALILRSTGP